MAHNKRNGHRRASHTKPKSGGYSQNTQQKTNQMYDYGGPQETVPGIDAFEDVKRLPPPTHLPGWDARQEKPASTPPSKGGKKQNQGRKSKSSNSKTGKPAKKDTSAKKPGQSTAKKTKKPPKPVNPAKRRRNRMIAGVVTLVVLIGAGLWFSTSVMFKIERYIVEGKGPYSKEEIVAVFGHEIGENMLGFNAAFESERIEKHLPYIEKVNIKRRFPDTVVFKVTAATEAYAVKQDKKYTVLSSKLKVLAEKDKKPKDLVEIVGLKDVEITNGSIIKDLAHEEDKKKDDKKGESSTAASASASEESSSVASSSASETASQSLPESQQASQTAQGTAEPGKDMKLGDGMDTLPASSGTAASASSKPVIKPKSDGAAVFAGEQDAPDVKARRTSTYEALTVLLKAIDASGITGVNAVDVSDPVDISFKWNGRIEVKLGGKSSIDEKMKFVKLLLQDPDKKQITDGDKGTLDVSAYPDTMDTVWFKPG